MNFKVYIMSGVSGSGKSTYAASLASQAVVFSADAFFVNAVGEYKFDPKYLGGAHAACLRQFTQEVYDGGGRDIVVDNTNTTVDEIAPYFALAQAFGYEPQILTIGPFDQTKLEAYYEACAKRNRHGVSLGVIRAQGERIRQRVLPHRWRPFEIKVEPQGFEEVAETLKL